jgi:isochorismate hydrolase
MADSTSPEKGDFATNTKRKGLDLKRAIVLIKDISILESLTGSNPPHCLTVNSSFGRHDASQDILVGPRF